MNAKQSAWRLAAVSCMLGALAWPAASIGQEAGGPVPILPLRAAMAKARKEARPMFVMMTSKDDADCTALKEKIATDPALQQTLAGFVVVEIDHEDPLAKVFRMDNPIEGGGTALPLLYVLTADTKPVKSSAALSGDALDQFLKLGAFAASARQQQTQTALGKKPKPKSAVAAAAAKKALEAAAAELPAEGQPADDAGDMPPAAEEKAIDSVGDAPASEDGDAESKDGESGDDDKEKPAKPRTPIKRTFDPLRAAEAQLRNAKVFEKSRPEKAREYALKAIAASPQSTYAKEARELLRRLK